MRYISHASSSTIRQSALLVAALLLLVTAAHAQQPASVPRSVLASGGEIMTGPTHTMIGTIGQPVIGVTQGTSNAIGQGFWYTIAAGSITSVDLIDGTLTGFELGKNYPNPFNPSTTIPFTVGRSAHVRLSVFNAYGQEVAVLVDQDLPAGNGTVIFDANTLPSGVYICRMTAGAFVAEQKMSLLK